MSQTEEPLRRLSPSEFENAGENRRYRGRGRRRVRGRCVDEQELITTDGPHRESRRHGIRRRENDEHQSCGRRNGGIRSRGSNDIRQI
jgi:hypothetical protein